MILQTVTVNTLKKDKSQSSFTKKELRTTHVR